MILSDLSRCDGYLRHLNFPHLLICGSHENGLPQVNDINKIRYIQIVSAIE